MTTIRALRNTHTKTFFSAESGLYRYWLSQRDGLVTIKLQASRRTMQEFRGSREGSEAFRFADVFEIGGGWYEITTRDLEPMTRRFGTRTDGARLWLRLWNLHHIGGVQANPSNFRVQYVSRDIHREDPKPVVPTDPRLAALAARFQSVHQKPRQHR